MVAGAAMCRINDIKKHAVLSTIFYGPTGKLRTCLGRHGKGTGKSDVHVPG